MLNTLDTVIAFAVIMTVLSLLITLVVQMVSAALSLRGKNLANALALTFQTIDPTIGKYAHSLAAQILRDLIFSDSLWQEKTRNLDENAQKFIAAQRKLRDAKLRRADDPNRADAISASARAFQPSSVDFRAEAGWLSRAGVHRQRICPAGVEEREHAEIISAAFAGAGHRATGTNRDTGRRNRPARP